MYVISDAMNMNEVKMNVLRRRKIFRVAVIICQYKPHNTLNQTLDQLKFIHLKCMLFWGRNRGLRKVFYVLICLKTCLKLMALSACGMFIQPIDSLAVQECILRIDKTWMAKGFRSKTERTAHFSLTLSFGFLPGEHFIGGRGVASYEYFTGGRVVASCGYFISLIMNIIFIQLLICYDVDIDLIINIISS